MLLVVSNPFKSWRQDAVSKRLKKKFLNDVENYVLCKATGLPTYATHCTCRRLKKNRLKMSVNVSVTSLLEYSLAHPTES